jgi:hypothetical protein
MDKIIDIIDKHLPVPVTIPLALQLIILIGMTSVGDLSKLVPPGLQKAYGTFPILTIAITAILLYLIMFASYIVLYLKYRNKLVLKCGVLWDRKNNPHCPSCNKPLQSHSYCSYQCIACDKYIFPFNEFSTSLPIEIVHRLLRGGKVTDKEIEDIHNSHRSAPMTYCTTVKMKEPYP